MICALTLLHAFMVDSVIVRICDASDTHLPKGVQRPALIVGSGHVDGLIWIRLAEETARNASIRIRHTTIDNHPKGREVHWNSAYTWFLRILGECYRAATGDSLLFSISRMSIWANSLILVVFVVLLSLSYCKSWGRASALAVGIGMIAHAGFYENSLPAYADHHGLVAIFLLGMLSFFLFSPMLSNESGAGSCGSLFSLGKPVSYSIVAGIYTGLALWVSAITTTLFLLTLAMAVFFSTLVCYKHLQSRKLFLLTESFITFGKSGLVSSVLLYLLEYFPNHIGIRLESNNPLYGVSFFCGVVLLAKLLNVMLVGGRATPRGEYVKAIFLFAGLLVLPALILIFREKVYLPLDPFFWGTTKGISELQPVTYFARIDLIRLIHEMIFFPVGVVVGLMAFFAARNNISERYKLLLLIICLVLNTFLACYQKRWLILPSVTILVLFSLCLKVFCSVTKLFWRRTFLAVMLCVGVLSSYATFALHWASGWRQFFCGPVPQLDSVQALYVLHRDISKYLSTQKNRRDVVLLSSGNSSVLIGGVNDFKMIGSFYWENAEGLKNCYLALASQSGQEALELFTGLGITHIALLSWTGINNDFLDLLSQITGKRYEANGTFFYRCLVQDILPKWVRPLPFPKHPLAERLGIKLLLMEFVPDQTLAEAMFHAARYMYLSREDIGAAKRLYRQVLSIEPDHAQAQEELSKLELLGGE